jgi:hypothetical protein
MHRVLRLIERIYLIRQRASLTSKLPTAGHPASISPAMGLTGTPITQKDSSTQNTVA